MELVYSVVLSMAAEPMSVAMIPSMFDYIGLMIGEVVDYLFD